MAHAMIFVIDEQVQVWIPELCIHCIHCHPDSVIVILISPRANIWPKHLGLVPNYHIPVLNMNS